MMAHSVALCTLYGDTRTPQVTAEATFGHTAACASAEVPNVFHCRTIEVFFSDLAPRSTLLMKYLSLVKKQFCSLNRWRKLVDRECREDSEKPHTFRSK